MNKFLIILVGLLCSIHIQAQTADAESGFTELLESKRDAVVFIKAFGQGGNLMATGTGFFIESQGVVISSYSIIKFASSVLVWTREGGLYDLEKVIYVYENPGLVKFSIKNPDNLLFPVLTFSESVLYEQDAAMAFGINDKNLPEVADGIASIIRMFEGVGPGLLLMMPLDKVHDGAPLLNTKGELIGVIVYSLVEKFEMNFAISILAILEHEAVQQKKIQENLEQQTVATKKSATKVSPAEIQKSLGTGYDSLLVMEKSIYALGDTIVDGWNEFSRLDALTDFIPQFVKSLKIPGSFHYPFDSLTFMFILKSPDEKFRIFSWALRFDDGTYRYYGAIQMDKEGAAQLTPLFDYSKNMFLNEAEDSILGPETWFGALYYDIMKLKYRKQTYYILLGWDGNNQFSSKKIIEVFQFDKNDQLIIGAPIFEVDSMIKYRRIFEFNNEYNMILKSFPEKKMIVFDQLVPPQEKHEGKTWLYIPSDVYNYYRFRKGKMIFHEDFFDDVNEVKAKKLIDKSSPSSEQFNINGARID
ncbi:MAG: trypsin-like peptidase domain-containing protein [Bacteroidetes bacterium]|nr:trypsin-like peptidase domain-containing protein [Bacteroidota bacterium]MBL6964359.1 trypsin-like peptidase domain-containing protein [Bacteroidota bacterium]